MQRGNVRAKCVQESVQHSARMRMPVLGPVRASLHRMEMGFLAFVRQTVRFRAELDRVKCVAITEEHVSLATAISLEMERVRPFVERMVTVHSIRNAGSFCVRIPQLLTPFPMINLVLMMPHTTRCSDASLGRDLVLHQWAPFAQFQINVAAISVCLLTNRWETIAVIVLHFARQTPIALERWFAVQVSQLWQAIG